MGEGLIRARVATVGHVEFADCHRRRAAPQPGEILPAQEFWSEAAGGGAIAAVQMLKLTGAATFFTALAATSPGAGRPPS